MIKKLIAREKGKTTAGKTK